MIVALDLRSDVEGLRMLCRHVRRALLLVFAVLSAPAGAATIFDTFDPGGSFDLDPQNSVLMAGRVDGPIFPIAVRSAAEFTVSGGTFALDSITLPISASMPIDLLRVRLTDDTGGAPGTTLETLSENGTWPTVSNPFTTTTTLTSSSHPLLADGASYWIVTELTALPTGFVNYKWFTNTSGTLVSVSVLQQQETSGSTIPSDPWTGNLRLRPLAFRVEGTPAPEPSAGLLIASGLAALAQRRRRSR
jgi:hypothetical protein